MKSIISAFLFFLNYKIEYTFLSQLAMRLNHLIEGNQYLSNKYTHVSNAIIYVILVYIVR